jgi:hypothetical protein
VISFTKALPMGALLTWIIASLMGSQHSKGGVLQVFNAAYGNPLFMHMIDTFYWSWPLFLGGTGLAWALFWMQDS